MEPKGSLPQSGVPATCPYPEPDLMEPEGSLPQSQVPATCPYPKPAFLMFQKCTRNSHKYLSVRVLVCVCMGGGGKNKVKSTSVSKPCVMRAYVWHAYTFSTFHMQWHLRQGLKPWFAKCFRKRYF
jgi:hypothetical protein